MNCLAHPIDESRGLRSELRGQQSFAHSLIDLLQKSIANEAILLKSPEEKLWGQVVGYVRAIDGLIIEPCTPIEN